MADRSVRVRISATDSGFARTLAGASAKARAFASDLDHVETRMSGIVQTGLALGPALVPVMAGAAPVAAGLASGMGAVAAGAGAAALAFSGVGDALEAVNDYQLEPTAENLAAMQQALRELGPAGADFVRYVQSLRPELDALQSIARQGMLPGVEAGIRQVMNQLPLLEDIVGNVSVALGDMAESGGQALAGPFWTQFLRFVRDDAAAALEGMGEGFGNIAEGFAGLTMALDPTADEFGRALLRMSEAFSEWGRTVGQTQGFREFVGYLREIGPQMGDTLGAVAGALVDIGKAAAPISGPVLAGIEGIANALSAIAGIPLVGPALIGAAAGVAALSRAVALYKATGMASLVGGLRGIDAEGKKASGAMMALGRGGLALVGLGVGVSVIDSLGRSLSDTLPGLNELQDRMRDLSTGEVGNLGPQFDDLGESIQKLAAPNWVNKASNFLEDIGLPPTREMREAQEDIAAIDTALADLVASEGPDSARRMFAAITEGMDPGTVKQFLSLLPGYRDALAGVGVDADLAAEGLTGAERAAARLNNELQNLSANLERRSAMRAYRDSIRQFNQVLEDGPKNLRRGTAAWDTAMGALDGIAAASVIAASHLKGLNKIEFMQQARRDFVTAAKQMGLTGEQARNLADDLGLVNQRGKIDIHLRARGLDKATQDLRRTKEAADDIPRDIDARVRGNTGDAQRDLAVVDKKMRDLDDQTASPRANLDDNASGKINAVDNLIVVLGGRNAHPSANLRDNASGPIGRVGGLLGALDGRTATVTIQTREITTQITNVLRNIVPGAGSAEGNIFEAHALGDVRDRHQPELAGPGPTRVWREPETKGESYIPHADDHRRPRAIDIWEATGRILGVDFVRYNAHGGLYGTYHFQGGGGFIGGPGPITSGYLQERLDTPERLPNLREYNRALAERARALAAVRRERRQLNREQKQARDAERDLRKVERELSRFDDIQGIRKQLREMERQEKQARRVLDAEKSTKAERREARKELEAVDRRRERMSGKEAEVLRLLERRNRLRDRERTQNKQAEAAEKQLADAKDAHAKAQRRVADAISDYADKQRQAIEQARQTAEGLAGTADIFGGFGSPMSAQRAVDQAIENVTEYGQILAQLRARGVHPWLLAQFEAQGPTDAGIRLGRALLSNRGALRELSRSAGALTALSERVGTMTADPRFMHEGAWNPTRMMSTRALNVDIRALDISQVAGEIRRQVQHVVRAELAAGAT